MQDTGAIMAAAFLAAVDREGLVADPALRLLAHVRDDDIPAAPVVAGPDGLGRLHENVVAADERVRRGAWYTPRWLADELVGLAFAAGTEDPRIVVDPACGGGAFLLAVADRLGRHLPAAEVVGRLRGRDIDPVAVGVAEAALWWWSARRGEPVVAGDRLAVQDGLTAPLPGADVVIGNPPFLGQLRSDTASAWDRRTTLRERFDTVVRPYTDEAWLFLLAAVETVDPGGVVVLLQPSSVLGARDASAVREEIDRRAVLTGCWIDAGRSFEAAVSVCAPVLRRRGPASDPPAATNDWTSMLAGSLGVPEVCLDTRRLLGDRVDVVAGFRDEYYGLVAAVSEGGPGLRLVTSGRVDPLRLHAAPVRFAKRDWADPRVDVGAAEGRAQRWLATQAGPKLVVATQTKVLEAVVDADGTMAASVPAIVVRPRHADDLWRVAAAVHAPCASAWLMRASAGTALSANACKPTAALMAALPLPVDEQAWVEAAELARAVAAGEDRWAEFGTAADRAYGIDDRATVEWWLDRLPLR